MKRWITCSCVAAAFAAGLAVETEALSAQEKQKPPEIRTLSGCVTAPSKRSFTLADAEQGQTYRLTGTDVRQYVGQHVEVLGAPSNRLVIKGGLYPSANVAGQAGAIDPVKAAMAAQSGPTSNEERPLVEFKVRSVRVTPGDCPKE
jgi:hypothetical protein